MFVGKHSFLGKNNFLPTQLYQPKFTKSNPLHMKITQMTQNCGNNTGTLKGATLFQKQLGASKENIHHIGYR